VKITRFAKASAETPEKTGAFRLVILAPTHSAMAVPAVKLKECKNGR
jgi:hypothetical protein